MGQMSLIVLSTIGVAAWLLAAGLVNAIRLLGELLEELDSAGPAAPHRHEKDGGRTTGR
jgi:hypothetical protein